MSTRFGSLGNLMKKQDLILNAICLLFAVGFVVMALSNVRRAGNFFSIDSLFITLVSLLLAGIFMIIPLLWAHENGVFKNLFAAEGDDVPVEPVPVHFEGTTKLFLVVLAALLGLTVVEVLLAYKDVGLVLMLTILVGLSLIKAALILAYFMHLRYERMSLVYTLIPMLVICICLLFIFFPDSFRIFNLRVY
ncbi:MAG TPA: cytochrome C oxidase subunit IV family protein, partial [Pyrinomonadaceae bacterium]